MSRSSFICLLIFNMVAAVAADLPAQDPKPGSMTRQQFNQVFVKVIVPVTSRTPKHDGPAVESWVADQLKQLGESEYFAVTDWVPVCDGLLEDDIVDNQVWDGRLDGKHPYCDVGGDIPQRKDGRVMVSVGGWTPIGGRVRITMPDEPGSRAVSPVRMGVGGGGEGEGTKIGERTKMEKGLPYVAVIIVPPPQKGAKSHVEAE